MDHKPPLARVMGVGRQHDVDVHDVDVHDVDVHDVDVYDVDVHVFSPILDLCF